MGDISTKPYLIRAIYEWCADQGWTPYLAVKVDEQTRVPAEHVKNGEIVLNIGASASHNLILGNDAIRFSARFGGVSRDLYVPVAAVSGIYAKENGQGLLFQAGAAPAAAAPSTPTTPTVAEEADKPTPPGGGKPRLHIVK